MDENILTQFAASLREQDRSPLTVKTYVADVRHFGMWFTATNAEPCELARITPSDLRAWRTHMLTTQKLQAATINRHLAAVHALCRWAQAAGHISANPGAAIKGVEQTKLAPRWLDRRQQFALRRALERQLQLAHGDTARRALWQQRDVWLIQLLLHTGLRVAELVALEVSDVTLHDRSGVIRVRGKGTKLRSVPLNHEARTALRAWLAVRPKWETPALFVSQLGERLQVRAVQYAVMAMGQRAGLEDLTPHILRHTFAKRLADQGTAIDRIAALLGHASLDTTRIYVLPSLQDLAQAVEAVTET